MHNKLKVLDIFSGIGGFSLGLERTGGFQTIAFCENDPWCQKILRSHWPTIPIFDDVEKLKGIHVGPVDAIAAGFPCQDASIANTDGTGTDGERTGLFREVVRLACELGPKIILLENVPELLARGVRRHSRSAGRNPARCTMGLPIAWRIGSPA